MAYVNEHLHSKETWKSTIEILTTMVDKINRDNGWHEEDRPFSGDIALLHSEVSEAYEAYRDGHLTNRYRFQFGIGDGYAYASPGDGKYERWIARVTPKPEGVPSELADIFIRLLDTCSRYEVDLIEATLEKLNYNRTRGYKHGGKAE